MIPAMTTLPYTLYRAEDVRQLDRVAIEVAGIAGIELMNRAGRAVFEELRYRWPEARRLMIVCGGGNNGGDGYVVARLAQKAGLVARVVALSDPARLRGDAALAWQSARDAGVRVEPYEGQSFDEADLIVDAIFGTGLDRQVAGHYADVIDAINAAPAPVVAVDIPSGLHADSGRALGRAVEAQSTVTFIGLKQGLLTGQGPRFCGRLVFDDLGVPASVYEAVAVVSRRIDRALLPQWLSPRPRDAHKGDCGHVLLIGGNHGFAGAVRMAAEAAVRVGAGLTTVATRPGHVAAMAAARPEVMWRGVDSASELDPLLARASVVAIGPGLGRDAWAEAMWHAVLTSGLPLVVDADALNLLAGQENVAPHAGWVVTPHPGEAARLLDLSAAEINGERFAAVRRLQHQFGGVAVLKGAGSLICDSEGEISLCSDGNPGMATGGMGDVLTGVIAALNAQGLSLGDAARAGVVLHAAAADDAALEGERGLLATDLMPHLRRLANAIP